MNLEYFLRAISEILSERYGIEIEVKCESEENTGNSA